MTLNTRIMYKLIIYLLVFVITAGVRQKTPEFILSYLYHDFLPRINEGKIIDILILILKLTR